MNTRFLTAVVANNQLKSSEDKSLVPWWSFTKTALAAGALSLVAKDQLELDTPLSEKSYTLRQLLQHTAGLRDYGGFPEYREAVARKDAPWSVSELFRLIDPNDLQFAPGRDWAYSNIGYVLVRQLIEKMTGKEIEDALEQLICVPLEISGIRLAKTPEDLSRTAWGNARGYHPGWVYHGLLYSTPDAAALFLHRLMTGNLLPPKLLQAMWTRYPLEAPISGRPWRTARYGLGLMIDIDSPHGRCGGHTGQGPGSTSAVYHFPDLETPHTVVAFADTEDEAVVENAALALLD